MIHLDFSDKDKKATSPKKEESKKNKPTPSRLRQSRYEQNPEDRPLTPKQEVFCQQFIKLNNAAQAAIKAGYSEHTAVVTGSQLLRELNVAKRINQLRDRQARPSIASSAEVMEFFTKAMRGEMKDQFGLDMSAADRTKAAIELAKRTVDLDQKLAGKPDATVEIKLDWKR